MLKPDLKASSTTSQPKQALLIAGILFIAINLRPALASVGPLVSTIRESTGLSNSMLGLLTALPLLAFGVVSMLTTLFTKRFGMAATLAGALLLITIGILVRSIDFIPALYIGTILSGIGIAFGNVLLPSLVKRNFESNSGLITSLYSGVMAVGAATAAGISVPLAQNEVFGWRGALAIWALLSFAAFFIWIPQIWRIKKAKKHRNFLKAMKHLTRSALAWKVAVFMGLQSFAFYVILAWVPDILQSRGFDASYSGWMLSLSQGTGVLGSLVIPIWAGRKKDQRSIILVLVLLEAISLVGLMFPQAGLVPIWVSLIGFALGGSFGLVLMLIIFRSEDSETAAELSGMAQSIGYLIAATGPILFGSIFDLTGNWSYSLAFLLAIALLKLYVGLGAGKPGKISQGA
ncbi:CP family cyanate transporter-like MFS transporter [Roseivirga ehrenbergii]|uniref:MFS transporter n=1 Tax=Roseivirga ehrenbergii (strain DSM 102268 / JCM 13514 / KCTC 12282 / NCIMB 14502 / KMM 6017) TaxID=279360 RepID=A0A150WZ15_ROSEK|nr:MFS transporter [Roseivirga ehrenbergii]KYG71730.1 MFS transporter [Roseivirga ehrenbergii]TCL07576.1 CP family cyanate transporter-like MFS transporter [Roseivirga ehrenbergii]